MTRQRQTGGEEKHREAIKPYRHPPKVSRGKGLDKQLADRWRDGQTDRQRNTDRWVNKWRD